MIKPTREQRLKIYVSLAKEFWRKTLKCLLMKKNERQNDKYCCMGIYEFVCSKFVSLSDDEFNKIVK